MIILYFANIDRFYKLEIETKVTRQTPITYEIDGRYYLEYHAIVNLITRKEIVNLKEKIKYGILYLPPDKQFYEIKDIILNV